MIKPHYLIYGHGGSYNHGGEAITRCTIELLRKIDSDCFITLSTHFPMQDLEFGIDADEIVARNLKGKTNKEIYQLTLDRITSNTIAIQVGGDNYCYANWQRYAQIHEETKKCGGKSLLWGCSIDLEKIDDQLFHVLLDHDLILAREGITFQNLTRKGLNNVLQVSDIAFTLEPERVDFPFDNYIVINISPLVCRKNPDILDAVQKLIHFVLKETEYNIVLLPHVVMPVDNDFEVLSSLNTFESNRIALVSDKLSAKQYKYIISKAHLCVAARTHVAIAAYSSLVPTLAIGYSTKAKGIAADLGFSDYVVDVLDSDMEDKILSQFKNLFDKKENLRQRLMLQMETYKSRVLNESVIAFLKGDYS